MVGIASARPGIDIKRSFVNVSDDADNGAPP
jgi:hypothetical protein